MTPEEAVRELRESIVKHTDAADLIERQARQIAKMRVALRMARPALLRAIEGARPVDASDAHKAVSDALRAEDEHG